MHRYELIVNGVMRPIFMDKEDIYPGDCIVIGSSIYKVKLVQKVGNETQLRAEKVGDTLYVAMLSEW